MSLLRTEIQDDKIVSPFRIFQAEGKESGSGTCGCGSDGAQPSKLTALAEELAAIIRQATRSAGLSNARSDSSDHAVPSDMPDEVYQVDGLSALPLYDELSHHFINGRHLWIGVQKGTAIVLNEREHIAFERMASGLSPFDVAESLAEQNTGEAAWQDVTALVGRLATSGFLKNVSGYHDSRFPQPERFARFHLTKACQLECIHCYADSSPWVDRAGELSTDRWLSLLKEFAAQGGERVLFTGGEALLHRGCIALASLGHELGLEVTLFTNGMQIPRYADQIRNIVDIVQVSLDGPDEESNDLIRGPGTFRRILRAIDQLVAQGTRVRIGMSVMEQNWEAWKTGFPKIAERYAGRVDYRLGLGITHYGRAENFPEELDIEEVQPKVERMLASVRRNASAPRITRRTTGCGYCEQFVVGPTGQVYPCHLLDQAIGHVDDRPVAEYTRLLREIAGYLDVDHTEGCNSCDIRYLCGGSCRVMNARHTGTRLITTCTPQERDRKYRNLVKMYSPS